MWRFCKLFSFSVLAAIAVAAPASGQSLKDRIKRRAEASIERRVDKAVDCAMGDAKCIEKAKAEGKTVNVVPAKDTVPKKEAVAKGEATPEAGTGAEALKPGEGAWANYDFKPGEKVLYADDFMKDEVGDFPRSLEFESGSLEIVEWKGARYLRALSDAKFFIVLPQPLSERYTLEFDLAVPSGALWISPINDEHKQRIEFHNGGEIGYLEEGRPHTGTEWVESFRDKMYRARVMADGRYIKLYINEKRLANIPNATAARGNKILFFVDGSQERPALFGAFRLASGGRKLYDALAEKGRVATQGIYFDTGSDRIRPESTPTLKEIAAMLNDHADLKLTIEGHTDNVGNASSNLTLSEKRATAVVAYLTAQGIDAGRLSAKGLGATKPADTNETPEGRQNNRRVELVKM